MMLARVLFTMGVFCFAALTVENVQSAESLYDEKSYRPLVSDFRAQRVGDLLTVQVFESSSASTTTDTTTQRNNGVNASLSGLNSSSPRGGSLSVGGSFDGGGATQRTNRLLANLTVTVREVLQNGHIKVSGEQLLTVNEEQHKVVLEGILRVQDISETNTVLSSRLADARIVYVGIGDLSERQKRSWWRGVLDFLGL